MSRIGKKPIPLPAGVKINIGERAGGEGPEGQADGADPARASASSRRTGRSNIKRDSDQYAALHGLTRALAANAVQGVSHRLHAGAGHRRHRLPRRREGQHRHLHLGYSHPIEVLLPRGRLQDRQADAPGAERHRPAGAGPGGGQHPRAAPAGSVQEQGHPVHRRSACARRSARPAREVRRTAGDE